MLDVFDDSGPAGRVYRMLLGAPESSVERLADLLHLPSASVLEQLQQLEAAGLVVSSRVGGWQAAPPEAAAAQLRAEYHRSMARIESAARELERTFSRSTGDASLPGMRLLHDRDEVYELYTGCYRGATQDVVLVERPPYYSHSDDDQSAVNEILDMQLDRLRAGVTFRTVYDTSVLADEQYMNYLVTVMAHGERVRTLPDVAVKFTVIDGQHAFIELDTSRPDYAGGLLFLEPSSLVDWLVSIFESLWVLAVPVTDRAVPAGAGVPAAGGALDAVDRRIVELMALGATDDAIARRLELSRRTVVRRVGSIMRRLGADNRFQAGIQAARRGWL